VHLLHQLKTGGDVMAAYENDDNDKAIYKVLINHEEQYSIWPSNLPTPAGWRDEGKSGTKGECVSHVEEVWVDMRPLSLRKRHEAHGRS
jgi:MbtH protein